MMNMFYGSVLILRLTVHILCQEIEYYPSQAETNFKLLNVRRLNRRQIDNVHKIPSTKITEFNKNINNNSLLWANDYLSGRSKVAPSKYQSNAFKRSADPIFHGHPKTREELWNERFLNKSTGYNQDPSLVKLLHNVTLTYLTDCTPVILYDRSVRHKEHNLLQDLFKIYPIAYTHGTISDDDRLDKPEMVVPIKKCVHFVLFLEDINICEKVIGFQATSKVVVVARSSQWAVREFLEGKLSRMFINLLVIAMSFNDENSKLESPYILYTHELYTDGLGKSRPVVLTSWSRGRYTRNVNLFPAKMSRGYAGHRLVVAAANQPPFVVRRIRSDSDGGNPKVVWDGIEIRILRILAQRNNFSIDIIEPQEPHLGPGDAVAKEVASGRADVGVAGMYLSVDRLRLMDMSYPHSQDCAAFITLMSTALPRYRAILGPFHWHVWLALTLTYMFGILPLAFSDKHTLRHLVQNKGEIENMFWYMFGTFTNCFTFVGKNSWSKTTKITTRLLIGWYWIFTIIITSCYTGCIIAFVTLPIYPETIDTIDQLLNGFYRTGTLDRGGWEKWFINSSDPQANKLLKRMEFVPHVEAGIRNITKAFFWPYAFLGSKAELEYIVQANFSVVNSKRSVLHVADECFVPFSVAMAFPNQSMYMNKLSGDIGRMSQNGLIQKIVDEVRWNLQRTSTGRLLEVVTSKLKFTTAEEKGLTLEDTQGMFLLLGAGFLIGASSLISEWMGGCTRKCGLRRKIKDMAPSNSERNLIDSHESSRNSSSKSRDTLEGAIIVLNRENIMIHNEFDGANWDSRRSSAIDVDREVREIFERDLRKRITQMGQNDTRVDSRSTSSKVFGGRICTP